MTSKRVQFQDEERKKSSVSSVASRPHTAPSSRGSRSGVAAEGSAASGISSESSSELRTGSLKDLRDDEDVGALGCAFKRLFSHSLNEQAFAIAKLDTRGTAAGAGLKEGDTIQQIDGYRVRTWTDLAHLALGPAGTWIKVTWSRPPNTVPRTMKIRRAESLPIDHLIVKELNKAMKGESSRGSSNGSMLSWMKSSSMGQALFGGQKVPLLLPRELLLTPSPKDCHEEMWGDDLELNTPTVSAPASKAAGSLTAQALNDLNKKTDQSGQAAPSRMSAYLSQQAEESSSRKPALTSTSETEEVSASKGSWWQTGIKSLNRKVRGLSAAPRRSTFLMQTAGCGLDLSVSEDGSELSVSYIAPWSSVSGNSMVTPGDTLTAIDGEVLQPGTTAEEAHMLLAGEPGSKVKLDLVRASGNQVDMVLMDIHSTEEKSKRVKEYRADARQTYCITVERRFPPASARAKATYKRQPSRQAKPQVVQPVSSEATVLMEDAVLDMHMKSTRIREMAQGAASTAEARRRMQPMRSNKDTKQRSRPKGFLKRLGGMCSKQGAKEAVSDDDMMEGDFEEEEAWEAFEEQPGMERNKESSGFHLSIDSKPQATKSYEEDGLENEMSYQAWSELGAAANEEGELSDEIDEESDSDDEEFVKATADFHPERDHELSLRQGQVLLVLDKHQSGWWQGCLAAGEGRSGWFPSNHVKVLPKPPKQKSPNKKDKESQNEENEAEFNVDIDYRNASWADDGHHRQTKSECVNYHEASWCVRGGESDEEILDKYQDLLASKCAPATPDEPSAEVAVPAESTAATKLAEKPRIDAELSRELLEEVVRAELSSRMMGQQETVAGPAGDQEPAAPLADVTGQTAAGGQDRVLTEGGGGEEKGVEQEESVCSVQDTAKAAGSDDSGSHREQQDASFRGSVRPQGSGMSGVSMYISDGSCVFPESSGGSDRANRLSELSTGSAQSLQPQAINGSKHLADWSTEEVLLWLHLIDLQVYGGLVEEKKIDGRDLNQLVAPGVTEESAAGVVKEWGIPNKYHAKRFLKKLALLAPHSAPKP